MDTIQGEPLPSSSAMDELQEDQMLHARAMELESAISTVLFCHNDPSQLRLANEWIAGFLSSAVAWPTSLYLAFPPQGSPLGKQQEVRFFSLNLLLSKIRNDWLNIPSQDAREIYNVLLRQLPLHHQDAIVGGRLCIVAGAAAALAGADTCYELVTRVLGESMLDLSLKIDLLTALAEETLHRGWNLSWTVKECMQECCPQVLLFLNSTVTCNQNEILGKMFTCFERWIPAGVVLSELYTEYGLLFNALLRALKSSIEDVFQPAVWALSELISQVDVLPGREQAVSAIVKTILEQKWKYDAAGTEQNSYCNEEVSPHARGLCLLLSEVASIEGMLLCRSGIDGVRILEWLVDASRGGGSLGLEGALMAVEAWPRLATIYHTRRGELLQSTVFVAAFQSILQAAKYPQNFESWEESPLEEELFNRFRTNISEGALVAFYKELGGTLLSLLSECLMNSSNWQDGEVCLYFVASISKEVIAAIHVQNLGASSFLKAVYTWLLASPNGPGAMFRQNKKFLDTALLLLKNYSEWTASDQSLVQYSIHYTINNFSVSAVRHEAACALKEICCKAASLLAATWPVGSLVAICEAALSVPTHLPKEQELVVQVSVVQGLAAVIGALPPEEAEGALVRVTLGAVSTIKEIAKAKEERNEQIVCVLESALNVVAGAVEYGFGDGRQVHPALRLLQDVWPALEALTITWASSGVISIALCNLWGSVANRVGMCISEVLPGIIAAASSMFKLHRVPAPLSCLSKVVALVSRKPTPDLEKYLAAMLYDVTSMLEALDKVMNDTEQKKYSENRSHFEYIQENSLDNDIGNCLSRMYELGQSFLLYFPALILPSNAFMQLFSSTTASINRKDPDVALAAAFFLLDCILGPSGDGGTKRDQRGWKLDPELGTCLDQVSNYYGNLIVEAILRRLAISGVVESLKEALSDVLYGFCISYPAVAEAAIVSTLNKPDFPGKHGFKSDTDKKLFLDSAIRVPPHPRVRFQDLMRVYSGVCQMLMSTEALEQF